MTDGEPRRLSIAELAEATGFSVHTLRYYEGLGVIPRVGRNAAGHRRYEPDHVDWMRLLHRLRRSGMSMRTMRDYAALVAAGDHNLEQRRELLREHERELERRIREHRESLRVIRAKIRFYEELDKDGDAVWRFPRPEERNGTA